MPRTKPKYAPRVIKSRSGYSAWSPYYCVLASNNTNRMMLNKKMDTSTKINNNQN